MYQSIEELSEDMKGWIKVTRKINFEKGIKRLLTNLYPDNAHFIYELLQNAEDTHAHTVRFILSDETIEFEHDGNRLFNLKDVESITSIGESTKSDDLTSIGKFGVGFKAVFAYTNTPEIHSGEFHFRIHDLVVPETINTIEPAMRNQGTRFIFPFNHPTKRPEKAVEEIERGLRALGNNTLLFLTDIRIIEYLLPDGSIGSLERIDHEGGHIEIRATHPKGEDTVSHWLRFQDEVEVVDEDSKKKSCCIAIAYSLKEGDKKKTHSDWKILPLDHGQVSIYFPAEKETSNLRFHIHAPFASTVARDSVRDCKENDQLRDHIAGLVVKSLADIRDRGMLTMAFLNVLPNQTDNLPAFYEPIREAIVNTFKFDSFTPTRIGGHAPAANLYRGPAKIAEALNDEDLSLLTNSRPPLWAANPPQQNQREDRFLDSLEIKRWEWNKLRKIFSMPHPYASLDQKKQENSEYTKRIETWIEEKEDAWIMSFYALLGEAYQSGYVDSGAKDFRIVRIEGPKISDHVKPKEAFFPLEPDTSLPEGIYFVKPTVYSIGRSDAQKKYATSFLTDIGVNVFDTKAATESKLEYYNEPPKKFENHHYRDLKQFIDYWKENPWDDGLFKDKTFLRGFSKDGDLIWQSPEKLFLDSPYLETGLAGLTDIHGKDEIWEDYKKNLETISLKDFVNFLKAVGVMHELNVVKVSSQYNPHCDEIRQDRCRRWTDAKIDDDYSIVGIYKYLTRKSIAISRLIWNALINAENKCAKAHFRPNKQCQTREAESQLVYHLRQDAWIPDNSGSFFKPEQMTKDDLHLDFLFDDRNGLLTAIGFGELAKKCKSEYVVLNNYAQKIGFESVDEAEEMAEFAQILRDRGQSPEMLIEQLELEKKPSFPSGPVGDIERFQKRFSEQIREASNKKYEPLTRMVRTTEATLYTRNWLKNRYINIDQKLVCQICKEIPFRKRNGEYYFEAVEAFPKNHLPKEHESQFLVLCPICAAMYKEFIKKDESAIASLKEELVNTDELEIPLKLGTKETSIRFVEKHIRALRLIIKETE